MIHTVEGFGTVNKAEIDVFLELFCFLHDPVDVGNLISGSSSFSKPSLSIWKFLVHIMLKPSTQDFKRDLTKWEVSAIVQWLALSLVLPFLGIRMKIDLFHPVATAGSSRFADILNATP